MVIEFKKQTTLAITAQRMTSIRKMEELTDVLAEKKVNYRGGNIVGQFKFRHH
jgi:hypothetical protein